jgi:hypothetical protein
MFKRFANNGPPSPAPSTSSGSSSEIETEKSTSSPSSKVYHMLKSRTFPLSRPKKSPEISPEQAPTPRSTPEYEPERRLAHAKTAPAQKYEGGVCLKPLTQQQEYETMPKERREAALKRVNKSRFSLGLPEKNLDKTLRPRKLRPVPRPHDSCLSVTVKDSENMPRCISPIDLL